WKKDLEKIGARNVEVVYWGYDEDDFKNLPTKKKDKNVFRIIHAGTVGFDRLPATFIKVLAEVVSQEDLGKKIEMDFYGPVDYELRELRDKLNLQEHIHFHGNVHREVILEKLQNADLQLLLLNKAENAKG